MALILGKGSLIVKTKKKTQPVDYLWIIRLFLIHVRNLSAEEKEKKPHARLSQTSEHSGRQTNDREASRQRTEKTDGLMIARKHRFNVLSSKGFEVFYRGKNLLIKTRPNDLTFPRFGVFLTKKNIPLSSQRIALKRLIFDFIDKKRVLSSSLNQDFLIINLAKMDKIRDNKPIIEKELEKAFNV